jgi:mRNA interferase HigB
MSPHYHETSPTREVEEWFPKWELVYDSVRERRSEFSGGSVVIFNVKGNRYRLEVLVAYQTGTVVVRWAGTHAEYTKRSR